ncbi:efflux RND transporter periplasmic adaptor subunit [Teredinibacter turnerae]|uniref:efflux RND transporter periplasmic adaptor subunit n=1 Tax=Teredinibacter turnerae TaxID=2426 RepID=UPI00047788E8
MFLGCSSEHAPVPQKQIATTLAGIPTVQVTRASVPREMDFDGVVEAVNQAVVSAQTSGRIVELPFDVGDFVAKGDVVARFTDTEQQAALAAAKAGVEEARARAAEASQQYARISDVFKKGLVAKAAFDQAEAANQAALARVESATAAVKDAQERVAHTRVIAPYSGIVVARLTDVGATVAPGTPLIEGLSLDHLRVRVAIPQQHIGPLRQHKKARVILASGQSVAVDEMRIPPSANAASQSFSVLLTLPSGAIQTPVFPGTLVKVAFVTEQTEALLVPTAAVAHRGEVTAAYVVADNRVSFRYLRLGKAVGADDYVVLAGLEPGEHVLLDTVAAASAYKSQTFSPGEH